MSRRKKRADDAELWRGLPASPPTPTGAAGSGDPGRTPAPRAPRPNRLFLAVTGVLLAAWIAFLVLLAAVI